MLPYLIVLHSLLAGLRSNHMVGEGWSGDLYLQCARFLSYQGVLRVSEEKKKSLRRPSGLLRMSHNRAHCGSKPQPLGPQSGYTVRKGVDESNRLLPFYELMILINTNYNQETNVSCVLAHEGCHGKCHKRATLNTIPHIIPQRWQRG